MRSPDCIDIASRECLDSSLQNAKSWCRDNLPLYLESVTQDYDYQKFYYDLNDQTMGSDMRFNTQEEGRIEVSARQLRWLEEREMEFENRGMLRVVYTRDGTEQYRGGAEVDPESMFVHEIAEFVILTNPHGFLQVILEKEFPHTKASEIENKNRTERGLRPWPEY